MTKKIELIEVIKDSGNNDEMTRLSVRDFKFLLNKINEIIEAINQLNEKGGRE